MPIVNYFVPLRPIMNQSKRDIRAFTKEELRRIFEENGDQAFRGNQVYEWLWQKGVHSFEAMTNLPKATREMLDKHFVINHIKVDVISSQVGCSLNCSFCATARLKRMRNLLPDEIFDQVRVIDEQSKAFFGRPLSNIVFMGMGEPLMNYNNVLKAIDKITSAEGLGMSPKRITLSTSGVPKLIKKMADDEVKFKLAVSLHSAIDSVRTSIMPFNEQFPLSELREALQYWYQKTKNRITYEYVVWKGINDQRKDVEALIKFCKFAPSKVNLIEYNPIDDGEFQQADSRALTLYQTMLEEAGITVTVRHSRGKDIDAACGQLANKTTKN